MRKAIGMGLLVAVLMAAVSYSVMWWMQASNARAAVQDAVAKLNDGQEILTYDEIATGGFPFGLKIEISKPHLQGRMDKLLLSMARNLPQDHPRRDHFIKAAERMPGWAEDISLDGTIGLYVNWRSDKFDARMVGNIHSKSTLPDTRIELKTTMQEPLQCHVALSGAARGALDSLWDFQQLLNRVVESPLEHVQLLDCQFPTYVSVELPSNEVVARTSSASTLRFENKAAGAGRVMFEFALSARDVEMTPAYDRIMLAYGKALFPDHVNEFSFNQSAYGKQNAQIQVSYQGPVDFSDHTKDYNLTLAIPVLTLSNALYSNDMTLNVSDELKGEQRASAVSFSSKGTFNQEYDRLLASDLRAMAESFANVQDTKTQGELPAALRGKTASELLQIFEPVIPRMAEFGTIRVVADANFRGNRAMTLGDYNVKELLFESRPYSLRLAGNISTGASGMMQPTGNLTLDGINSMRMIDDAASYLNRMATAAAYFDVAAAQSMAPDATLVAALKSFINAIAVKPANANAGGDALQIHATSDTTGGVMINQKPMAEVLALLEQHFAPFMPKQN